jgi:hypothetical protein
MYDPVNDEEFYFYPNIANTNVYERPFVVNSRADVRKLISDIRMKELSDSLNYPKSGIKVKSINGFKVYIDYRNHALGDSDALVPDFIKNHIDEGEEDLAVVFLECYAALDGVPLQAKLIVLINAACPRDNRPPVEGTVSLEARPHHVLFC